MLAHAAIIETVRLRSVLGSLKPKLCSLLMLADIDFVRISLSSGNNYRVSIIQFRAIWRQLNEKSNGTYALPRLIVLSVQLILKLILN